MSEKEEKAIDIFTWATMSTAESAEEDRNPPYAEEQKRGRDVSILKSNMTVT